MSLILLCQFSAQHVSDVSTPIFRSLLLLGVLLHRLYCAGLRRVGVSSSLIVDDVLSDCMLNHYSLCNNTPSSRKLLKMGVLTSETC